MRRYPKPAILGRIATERISVIEASAGTGKTFTLEHLVLELLLSKKIPLEKILAVTFTVKATMEIESRIRRKLESLLSGTFTDASPSEEGWDLDGETRQLAFETLTSFDRAPIHTIHSFCQKVLLEHAFLNGRLFDQEQTDMATAFEQAFNEVLREALVQQPLMRLLVHAWKEKGKAIHDLRALLLECARMRGEILPAIDWQRLEGIVTAHAAKGEATLKALVTQSIPGLEPALAGGLLPLVIARMRRNKEEAGLFDYQDMLDLVWESLNGPHGYELIEILRSRYKAVLIDEFQDTDTVQWAVFRRLFFDSPHGHRLYVIGDPKQAIYGFRGADVETFLEAREEIKRAGGSTHPLSVNFRSTAAMVTAINTIFGWPGPDAFFDSHISYTNPMSAGLPETAITGPSGLPLRPVALITPDQPEAPLKAGHVRTALAHFIANEIKQVAQCSYRTKERSERLRLSDILILTRSHTEGDFVAEVLKHHEVPFAFFRRDGLFKRDEASHIFDLLSAVENPQERSLRTKALLTPFFGFTLDGLLESPDHAHSQAVIETFYEWNSLAQKRHFAALFTQILAKSRLIERELFLEFDAQPRSNYRQILEWLLDESHNGRGSLSELLLLLGGCITGSRKPPGEDSDVERLAVTGDAVRILTVHKAKGLEATVVFLFGGYSKARNSKLCHLVSMGRHRSIWTGKLEEGKVKSDAERIEHEEDQRLLYVAATRARARLYLPYFPSGSRQGKGRAGFSSLNGFYSQMNSRLEEIVRARGGDLPPEFEIITHGFTARPPVREQASPEDLMNWVPAIPVEDPAAGDEARRRLRTSHSGLILASYTGLKGTRPQRAPAARTKSRREGELSGTAAGQALHEILEAVPLERAVACQSPDEFLEDPLMTRLLRGCLERYGLDEEENQAQVGRLVFSALRSPLKLGEALLPGLALATAITRETEFHFPIPEPGSPELQELARGDLLPGFLNEDKGFIRGVIDVLFCFEGKTYILDWKSDLLPDYSPPTLKRRIEELYALQPQVYSLAVARMLRLMNERDFNGRFGGFLFAFIRGMAWDGAASAGIHHIRPSWRELLQWETSLRAQVVSEAGGQG